MKGNEMLFEIICNPGETKTLEATTLELASGVQNPVPSAVATPL